MQRLQRKRQVLPRPFFAFSPLVWPADLPSSSYANCGCSAVTVVAADKVKLFSTEVSNGSIQRGAEGVSVMVIVLFVRCSGAAMEKPPSSDKAELEEGRSLVEVGGGLKNRVDSNNILKDILFEYCWSLQRFFFCSGR